MIAIAGNKDDMYETEEVDDIEAKNFADSINAIFQKTSAKSANGIEDLFVKIGQKFMNPKGQNNPSSSPNPNSNKKTDQKDNIKLNKKNTDGKQKKGCC